MCDGEHDTTKMVDWMAVGSNDQPITTSDDTMDSSPYRKRHYRDGAEPSITPPPPKKKKKRQKKTMVFESAADWETHTLNTLVLPKQQEHRSCSWGQKPLREWFLTDESHEQSVCIWKSHLRRYKHEWYVCKLNTHSSPKTVKRRLLPEIDSPDTHGDAKKTIPTQEDTPSNERHNSFALSETIDNDEYDVLMLSDMLGDDEYDASMFDSDSWGFVVDDSWMDGLDTAESSADVSSVCWDKLQRGFIRHRIQMKQGVEKWSQYMFEPSGLVQVH